MQTTFNFMGHSWATISLFWTGPLSRWFESIRWFLLFASFYRAAYPRVFLCVFILLYLTHYYQFHFAFLENWRWLSSTPVLSCCCPWYCYWPKPKRTKKRRKASIMVYIFLSVWFLICNLISITFQEVFLFIGLSFSFGI